MPTTDPSPIPRRIAAIVLPRLACELARIDGSISPKSTRPFAVIVHDRIDAPVSPRATLDAVDALAWRCGARPGQTAAEASAFVANLQVVRVASSRIEQALAAVAELASSFGTTTALRLDEGSQSSRSGSYHAGPQRYPAGTAAGPRDTVWVDITGCARLQGGEDLLCADLRRQVAKLGHTTRVAVASGPRIARAMARWCGAEVVVPPKGGCRAMASLPISALPIPPALMSWFGKLGLLRVDDLASLDRARLAHRLGPQARDLLELIGGRDHLPLIAYQAPRRVTESTCFDEPIKGTQPLMFVLRGLVSRAATRLAARGEACSLAKLDLSLDRGVIALRDVKSAAAGEYAHSPASRHFQDESNQQIAQHFPSPLYEEEKIIRALSAKIEHARFGAPITSVTLTLDALCKAPHTQIEITSDPQAPPADPQAMAGLLAELSAWVGKEQIGVLSIGNSHRPEAQSRLVPATPATHSQKRRHARLHRAARPSLHLHGRDLVQPGLAQPGLAQPGLVPTRLLPVPIHVGPIRHGSLVHANRHLYNIEQLRMTNRIDGANWWSSHPVRRDYAHALLHSGLAEEHDAAHRNGTYGRKQSDHEQSGHEQYSEAWVFIDRASRRGYLHGWFE